jgi:hypothetical protein
MSDMAKRTSQASPDLDSSPAHGTCNATNVNTVLIARVLQQVLDDATFELRQVRPLACIDLRRRLSSISRRAGSSRGWTAIGLTLLSIGLPRSISTPHKLGVQATHMSSLESHVHISNFKHVEVDLMLVL